jgi:hypothetical protein
MYLLLKLHCSIAFTSTLVFPSNAIKSLAEANALVSVNVNVKASVELAFVNALFKFAAVPDVTVAVTIPVVSPRIVFALATLAVSLNVVA